jgi:thiol:disulfide interchange protein DsbC
MKIHRAVRTLLVVSGAIVPCALPAAPESPRTIDSIRQKLESRFAGIAIVDVRPSPLPGLYEVFTGDAIVYVDASGDHMLAGPLVDTATRRDLTAERVNERNAIDFKSLPFDKAIKIVKGNGTRQLAVFADPDCPYCRKLESELETVTDLTLYVFLYPIPELHADAVQRSHAIWCAPDRAQAWSQWMLQRKASQGPASCEADPVDELQVLGRKLNITGTPMLFPASGRRIAGALSAAEIEGLLDSSTDPATQAPKAARTAP